MSETNAMDDSEPTDIWDALVVGAGPAGAVASYLLARAGVRTLLADAKSFPRSKVCGGCLNARAVSALRAIGLGNALDGCGASSFHRLAIHHAGRSVEIALPSGLSVTRSTLDTALVHAATNAGAMFIPETRCRVLPRPAGEHRRVRMTSTNGRESIVAARIVLACDGLGHHSLQSLPELKCTVSPRSRIGLGGTVDEGAARHLVPSGSICMAVAAEGYVGLAQAESGRLSVAAAVDPGALVASGAPVRLVQRILQTAGLDGTWLRDGLMSRGTPPITQCSSQAAAERLLLVGDAAGYVEPFTGEGMAAAIEGAMAVVPLAKQAAERWHPNLALRWQVESARRIRWRQPACHTLAWLVRHPRMLRWCMASVACQPSFGDTIARWIGSARASIGNPVP